jgi:hypothetical protein
MLDFLGEDLGKWLLRLPVSIPAEILRAGKELTDFISTGGSMFLF